MSEQVATRILATLALALVAVVLLLGLVLTGPDVVQGEVVRLLYVHPAVAWVAYVAFGVTSVASLLWLWPRRRSARLDRLAGASAEVGVVFTGLALVTGSIWGRSTWGVWWTWDARLTATAILFLMYLGVLALRRVDADPDTRARRSAIAALLAFVNVPIVHFSVNWWRTLHQKASVLKPDILQPEVHGLQLVTMLLSFLAFTLVYVWLVVVRVRIARWEDHLAEGGLGAAIAARRSEAVVR